MATVASPMAATPTHTDKVTHMSDVMSYLNSRVKKDAVTKTDFQIPVIDLGPSYSESLADRKAVAAQIRQACQTSGFFYIKHHSIPIATCDKAIEQAAQFFKTLPLEKKEALHMRKSDLHRGWEPKEFTSIHGATETKEAFNWGYDSSLDPTGGDGKYVEMDGTSRPSANVWPDEADLPGFLPAIKDYYGGLLELARHLFRLFALSLELPETHFDKIITHLGAIARIMYYPAATPATQAGEDVGLGAHTDYEFFTILLTSGPPGLEILTPDNEWISAPAVEGTFIVNVADFMMRWTNDEYKSTIHRVVNRSQGERYSIPAFFSVNYDEIIEASNLCRDYCEAQTNDHRRSRHAFLQRILQNMRRYQLVSTF